MDNMAINSWAYAILGLDLSSNPNPDWNAIKDQFRKISLTTHPDKCQSSDKAKVTARYQDILKAYKHLELQQDAGEKVIEEKATADRPTRCPCSYCSGEDLSQSQPTKNKKRKDKVTADRWEIQPPRSKRKDRQNGHFRQGDENKKKIEGRQARAMYRLSKIPRSNCSTVKRKAHSQLERREREEREQRATEKKQYAPKSLNTTTRVAVDFYRDLNASSRQMRGTKPLRPEIGEVEETYEDLFHFVFIMEEEEWRAAALADMEKQAHEEEVFLPMKREPLTEYMQTEASKEESKAWRKSRAIPKKLKTLAGEDNAEIEDLRVPEYIKRYILEELVEETADDETLERELACIEWGDDVDNWALDAAQPQGFKLEHILPTGFHLAHLPSRFIKENEVALPIGFQVIDAPPRREFVMVDDLMVGVQGRKREIFEESEEIGFNMEKRVRKIFARRREKERRAVKRDLERFL
jgi:curved DNA-binding protein CbpA